MKTFVALLITLTTTVAFAQPKPSADAQKQNQQSVGPIAGGGGFSNTNGAPLLEQAQATLLDQLQKASWKIFVNADMDQEQATAVQQKLIQLVSTMRQSPEKTRKYRKNQRNQNVLLEFDYGTDADGDYIEALEPFFIASSMVAMPEEKSEAEEKLFRLIHRKILHEAAHHLGFPKDDEAAVFAKIILERLDQHVLLCTFNTQSDNPWQRPYFFYNQYSFIDNNTYYTINTVKGIVSYVQMSEILSHKKFADVTAADLPKAKETLLLEKTENDKFFLKNTQNQRSQIQLTSEVAEGQFHAVYLFTTVASALENSQYKVLMGFCRSLVSANRK